MLAFLIPLVAKKVTDFLGLLQHGRWGAAGRQAAAWATACAAVMLAAHSPQLSAGLGSMIDLDLAAADLGVQLAVGIGLGSAGSAFFDLLKARDNTQSAAGPKLFGPDEPAPAASPPYDWRRSPQQPSWWAPATSGAAEQPADAAEDPAPAESPPPGGSDDYRYRPGRH